MRIKLNIVWINRAIERLLFWTLSHTRGGVPFWYMNSTGAIVGLETYSIFTDEVTYRPGQFGTSRFGPYPTMSRQEFLALGEQGYTDLRAAQEKPGSQPNQQKA